MGKLEMREPAWPGYAAGLRDALRGVLTSPGLARPDFAVLAPIVCRPEGPELLVEVRAEGISQSGDPCLPGGHIEAGEAPLDAALRELYEELGIRAEASCILGQMPTVQTPFGLRSDIFVGLLSQRQYEAMRPNPSEVSVVLHAPISFFLRYPCDADFPLNGHIVWGMTARAIHTLCAAWRQAGLPEETNGMR